VCAGYLYATRRDVDPSWSSDEDLPSASHSSAATLVAECRALEREAEHVLARPSTNLDDALVIYLQFYRLWAAELSPRIARLRASPASFKSERGARPSSVEATLAACARGTLDFAEVLRRIGALAPTWDVAIPTFGERPDLLREAIALAVTKPTSSSSERASVSDPASLGAAPLDLSSVIADLAERDDLLFARAQWIVRRALLAIGERLAIGDDVFWIRFADLASLEPEALRRKAAGARAAAERARQWQMPVVVGADPLEPAGAALRGIGQGPAVVGRVVRFESLARAVLATAGDVIVVRAVTPALAVFVGTCAAIVSETGGLLDHGAALARELGITCVVGCRDAWTMLVDGEVVRVDGDAGTVTRS
jgi:pyruvate,water dikinase